MPVVQAGDDVIEFPDSMSSEDIQSVLRKKYISDPLDFATQAPVKAVSDLTRTLELGAEGADMGRRQLEKERLAGEMAKVRKDRKMDDLTQALVGGEQKVVGAVSEFEPLNLLKRTMEIPAQLSGSPYRIRPLVTPEQVRSALVPTAEDVGSVSSGVQQAGAELLSGLTSPDQVAALAAGKVNPELVARLFQTKMASEIPSAAQQLQEAVQSGDKAAIGKAATSLAATAAIPAVIERGVRGEEKPTVTAATYTDPKTGETTTAPNHVEAAAKQGVDATGPKESRNTPEFGMEVTDPVTGEKTKETRKEATETARESGQLIKEPKDGEAHTSDIASPVDPTKPLSDVPQGPGARTAGSDESFEGTGLKNAIGEVERAAYGLPESTPTEKRAIAQSWIKAGTQLEQNPTLGTTLVDELKKNPDRGLDDVESMVLLRHKVGIENAINDAAERTNTSTDPSEKAKAQSEFSAATAQLGEFLDAVRARGSSAGREFRLRQVLAKQDYSLATMTKRFRAERNGRGITDAEQAEIAELSKKLADTEKRATEAESKAAQEASQRAAEAEINRLALEASREDKGPQIHPKILDIAENIVRKMEVRADAATARLREKMTRFSAGVDPTIVLDLAEIGAAKISRGIVDFGKWSEAMLQHVKDDRIKPFLQDAWEKSQELFNSDTVKTAGKSADAVKRAIKKTADLGEQREILTERIKAKMETHRLDEVHPLVQELAKTFSKQGLRGWRAINDAVHGVLKTIIPDLDYRETMDAVSGHGKFRVPSQVEADAALRDAKAQTNQIRKIQEVIARQPVQPTGFKRDIPSDVVRRLTQIYENAKRRFGITVTDPARQLKTALQTRKTYYTNRMSDLQSEINARKRIVKNKALPPTDPELEALIAKYRDVKAAHDAVFGQRNLTDEQRATLEAKALDRQIEEIQRQIKEGDIFPTGAKPKFQAAANEAKRANLEALKSEREYLRDSIQPKSTPEEVEMDKIQKRRESLHNSIDEAVRKINEGDLESKKQAKRELTPELQAMRDELSDLNKIQAKLRQAAKPKKTPEEIALTALKSRLQRDTADKLDRMARGDFSKAPKRPAPAPDPEAMRLRDENAKVREEWEKRLLQERYANRTMAGKMADMAVQWSRISKLLSVRVYPKLLNAGLLRSVFEPISRIAGQPLRLIAPDVYQKARVESGMSLRSEAKYWSTAVTSWGKAWEKLRTGSTNIDRIRKEQRVRPDLEMLNFVGNSHGMFKEPFRQAAFERSKQLAAEAMIKAGENPDDPLNTTQILSAAAENSDRNIFTQPNMVTKYLVKLPIAALKADPFKGAAALGRTMEFLMPIVNVGSNIAAHTMRLNPAIGFTEAALRLRGVRKSGVLTTADAEAISRAFKLGSLGTILAAYAWNNPDQFGGVYEERKKKSDEGPKPYEVDILGVRMPAFLSHAPEILWLNTVASARRVRDRYVEQNPDQTMDANIDAAWFATLAPVKNFPIVDAYVRLFSESHSMGRTAGALVRDAVVPGVVTSTMKSMDSETRKPKTFTDELKMGIPGLRSTVPTQ